MNEILQKRIEKFKNIDIYPVISSEFCNKRPPVQILKDIAAGGAKIVQLREKNMTKNEIFHLAMEYRQITNWFDMLLIINDHVDIALAVKADGVHLGQDDLPLVAARMASKKLIFGSSTHNMQEAIEAINDGASYINVGPIYETQTKEVGYDAVGLEQFKQINDQIDIPVTVMGGIKEHHIAELKAHGAKRIAMVTEITMCDDVTNKVQALRDLIIN
ncbi:thiamine phosphate synthase [Lentisphaerota bacterium WC36G]|nr:thiamine phosphate synthase [Lentisphaerae bacterium WC36]